MLENMDHEEHFRAPEVVRDAVLGMSDGLTVPFALAAGLAGAVDSSRIVVIAGVAEIVAGAISMGLGGHLAARSEAEHYETELAREWQEVEEKPQIERAEVDEILRSYGLKAEESLPVVEALSRRPKAWVDFMMRFELGLERPDPGRALKSALTIGGAYMVGGFIPLLPYFLLASARRAFGWSVAITLFALLVFGYVKGRFTGAKPRRSAAQTAAIGATAAAAAYFIAKWVA